MPFQLARVRPLAPFRDREQAKRDPTQDARDHEITASASEIASEISAVRPNMRAKMSSSAT